MIFILLTLISAAHSQQHWPDRPESEQRDLEMVEWGKPAVFGDFVGKTFSSASRCKARLAMASITAQSLIQSNQLLKPIALSKK